ncbi:TIGR04104 family putative zinc finger protein [Alkalihalobacterium alkalinitrilicum]|uniref:TIGR04104 family putative zinc finger protein n=1 Tax=Alkalihalobacterium alkalinitrilicum TaxID=427920 RepID=UPI0009952207|nr:TIGR04104 family putative zinc finger protein [Alkalihalobacterium alkalinitrilicum]
MAQQKCESCGTVITKKEIQKSLLKGYRPIPCSNCGTVHQIKEMSKLIIAMIVTFPIVFFVLLLSTALGLSGIQTTVVGVIMLVITILSLPFIAKYELAENHEM